MRHDYVQACARFFSRPKRRKLYPMRPEGFARIARVAARFRRRFRDDARGRALKSFGGSTVREWFWRWRNSGFDYLALLPCHDAKGRTGPRLDGEVIVILGHWLRTKYLTLEKPDATVVYDCAMGDIDRRNEGRATPLEKPSYTTFLRLIGAVDRAVRPRPQARGREGGRAPIPSIQRAPRRPCRSTSSRSTTRRSTCCSSTRTDSLSVRRPPQEEGQEHLSRLADARSLQGDQNDLRLPLQPGSAVVDQRHGRPLHGRPAEGPDRPRSQSGMARLRRAEGLVMDNGPEFHSRSLRAATGQLRIKSAACPEARVA